MRIALPLLAVLLSASVAWAGVRVNGRELSRQEEVGLYCSVCMAVVFGPIILVMLVQGIRHWMADRSRRKAKRGPPDFR